MKPIFLLLLPAVCWLAFAQESPQGQPPGNSLQPQAAAPTPGAPGPTIELTLQQALVQAARYEPQFLAAATNAAIAREDAVQARAARLPAFGVTSQYLNTQGNGVWPSGRFVTNDGVHVYREWATMHEDVSADVFSGMTVARARALEAAARARAEIARRGLAVTVTKAYYALAVAELKYANAQLSLDQARRLLTITQQLERGGEVAHSDVVKAQLQYNAQEQALREAQLALETARIDLAVLLFPNLDQNFRLVSDLTQPPPLPPLEQVRTLAARENPDVRAAVETLRSTRADLAIARQAFLPVLTVDLVWGLEANQIGWNTVDSGFPENGAQPTPGYFLTAALTLPVWDWGARKSKVRQAQIRQRQADVELSATERTLLRNITAYYAEAQTARQQIDLLRQQVTLAEENLRLNTLRYQAGEATILELVDAETTLQQARNALDDGLVRYRLAVANLQTLTGAF